MMRMKVRVVILLLSMIAAMGMATFAAPINTIMVYDNFDSSITSQEVAEGATMADLTLPTTVTAGIMDSTTKDLTITDWLSNPVYTSAFAAGTYTLTPNVDITGYTEGPSAVLPVITVTAVPAIVTVTTSSALKVALETSGIETITVGADITFDERITQNGSHTLVIPSGMTITANECLNIGSNTLTINGGGTYICDAPSLAEDGANQPYSNGLYSKYGTLNLENITINITSVYRGLEVNTLNINNGARVNLNTPKANMSILMETGFVTNLNTGGVIDLVDFYYMGLTMFGGEFNVNGGSLIIEVDDVPGLYLSSGTLRLNSGSITGGIAMLNRNVTVEGVAGLFVDQGKTLTNNGAFTVGESNQTPSEDGLTAAYYYWRGSNYERRIVSISIDKEPQDVNVLEGAITESLSTAASASDDSEVSYSWEIWDDKAFAFGDMYFGDYVMIEGATDATYALPTDLTAGSYAYRCLVKAPKCEGYNYTREVDVTVYASNTVFNITANDGSANALTAVPGDTVTITADTAPEGQRFKAWTVVNDVITLTNMNASSTTFVMPFSDVTVTAIYEDIPDNSIPVTGLTLNKYSLTLYSNTESKTETLLATVTPADATDKSVYWSSSDTSVATVSENGTVTTVSDGLAVITAETYKSVFTTTCAVTVATADTGANTGSSKTKTTTTTRVTEALNTAYVKETQAGEPVMALAPVTAVVGTGGTAKADIPDSDIADAIAKAQSAAEAQDQKEQGISVGLAITMPKGATSFEGTLTREAFSSFVSAGVTQFEISGAPVAVSFDQASLQNILKQSSGNLTVSIVPRTNISPLSRRYVGSRPVYDITVSDGTGGIISDLGGGVVTLGIPYSPATGEYAGGLYAVYINEDGVAERVAGSFYNAKTGMIAFEPPHLSLYGVGYGVPGDQLEDISAHWAKDSIAYVVNQGLMSGETETAFAPDSPMTRGLLVSALGKLAGVDTAGYLTSSFTDVAVGTDTQPYIEWAYESDIVHGIGNSAFAPDRAITREEAAEIILNFTEATGYQLPEINAITPYQDEAGIGESFVDAVNAMQQSGIMTGDSNKQFNPKNDVTRAEVASILYQYVQKVIQ